MEKFPTFFSLVVSSYPITREAASEEEEEKEERLILHIRTYHRSSRAVTLCTFASHIQEEKGGKCGVERRHQVKAHLSLSTFCWDEIAYPLSCEDARRKLLCRVVYFL